MTIALTTKLKLFLNRMTENAEQQEYGFKLLLERADFDEFFDLLSSFDLFSSKHNPTPISADQPGYVHIPYWYALNYLEAVAKRAGERNDVEFARKILDIMREVSQNSAEQSLDNHHTWRKFSEILGYIPVSEISVEDIDLISIWLNCKFDRGMVGVANLAVGGFVASEVICQRLQ
ncbi:MAG: hypothetical protein RBS57_01315 [Desulforhabdus sp.]|jgi:hypothetical protein|nr:hypothetical protein [Desulforhabdus sp.]